MIDEIVQIDARDGISIGVRIYRPDGAGPYPALFVAAP
jgi:predicted acyl esterase